MDRFETSQLRAYYGNLLTERQNEFLALHFDEDLSYGEIAQMFNVTRQAVLGAITKGEKALKEYEEKLHLVQRDLEIKEKLDQIEKRAEKINDAEIKDGVKSIKRILEDD